jgi:hypothetical protein
MITMIIVMIIIIIIIPLIQYKQKTNYKYL